MKQLFVTYVEDSYQLTTAGYAALIILMILSLIIAATIIHHDTKKKRFDTKQMIFCAVSMALAMVTSMIKLYSFPFGGSVTLFSMFFICFIGYLYGPKAGLMTGISYGILQLIINPYILFPMQVVVDYVLAFGALGLSGFFWKSKNGLIKGYIAGILGRYFFAVLSGWLFFGEYAWNGWAPLPYSLVYNGCYIFTEGLITLLLLAKVAPVKNGLAYVRKLSVTES
ncbi:energy-coupled thiamine transporter ThiT [Velocimicrobium porci]|uniref:Energy-coupled thiamine transporter ThiT n=1 Tax=Velocimicrobium porci TaxID=2606634 RepID=A0A6L5Y004_9FIRM|nr:energy-coupled thiamine transporter ThiT [Velocimicrobium porci]MSS64446.1 energy-coupled thiamine transporter ThiT [Velocimicrobium porci]